MRRDGRTDVTELIVAFTIIHKTSKMAMYRQQVVIQIRRKSYSQYIISLSTHLEIYIKRTSRFQGTNRKTNLSRIPPNMAESMLISVANYVHTYCNLQQYLPALA